MESIQPLLGIKYYTPHRVMAVTFAHNLGEYFFANIPKIMSSQCRI